MRFDGPGHGRKAGRVPALGPDPRSGPDFPARRTLNTFPAPNHTMTPPMDPFAKETLPVSLEAEMRHSYLDYAMSVIVGRALPDVRDGLKPVHRRVLYAMHEANIGWNRPYVKCARVVGDVMGKYHPHGDMAIYDTLVRMAQDFSLRYPLIDGQGNFGSVDGDNAAAMRYTECRLQKIADELIADIDKETVDFVPNYDGKEQEPRCCRRGCRTCSSTGRRASRSAWRPTSRRTT